jgi:hypothetical protein
VKRRAVGGEFRTRLPPGGTRFHSRCITSSAWVVGACSRRLWIATARLIAGGQARLQPAALRGLQVRLLLQPHGSRQAEIGPFCGLWVPAEGMECPQNAILSLRYLSMSPSVVSRSRARTGRTRTSARACLDCLASPGPEWSRVVSRVRQVAPEGGGIHPPFRAVFGDLRPRKVRLAYLSVGCRATGVLLDRLPRPAPARERQTARQARCAPFRRGEWCSFDWACRRRLA